METNGMKQSIFLKISAITFLMAGVVFCSCSNSNDEPIEPVGPKTYTLTIEASKGGSAETRVLEEKEGSLVSTWKTSDKVYVTKSRESSSCGLLQPQSSGATATLSGKITGTFAQGDGLTFQYPRETKDYTGQKGTLADISAKYDYSVATAEVDNVSENVIAIKNFKGFTNQQAIVKFTLKDAYGYAVNATSLKVSAEGLKTSDSATGDIIVNVPNSTATDVFYVALSGISSTTVSLTATAETDTYVYEKSNVTFSNGNYYEITVKMKSAMLYEPLTFEAVNEGDTRVTFSNGDGSKVDYSIDGGTTWYPYSSSIDPLNKGDKICFRLHFVEGSTAIYYSENDPIFNCDNDCYVYGNVMSLVDPVNYKTATTLNEGVQLWGLFQGNTKIINHSNKPLLLPATEITYDCYKAMFMGCTNLTRAPILPASSLWANCYQFMFSGCSKLNYIKCLATNISATDCTKNWVDGVASEGTFVKAANADWSSGGIPSGWTVTTE